MKRITSAFLVLFFLLIATTGVDAKVLPRFKSGGSIPARMSGGSSRGGSSITVSPSFMPGRGGLHVEFGNLQNATSVKYVLSYETNGKTEGVSGTINPAEGNTSRDLQFATCSSGVCRNHGRISNMKLEVTSKLTNGKTSVKRFRINK